MNLRHRGTRNHEATVGVARRRRARLRRHLSVERGQARRRGAGLPRSGRERMKRADVHYMIQNIRPRCGEMRNGIARDHEFAVLKFGGDVIDARVRITFCDETAALEGAAWTASITALTARSPGRRTTRLTARRTSRSPAGFTARSPARFAADAGATRRPFSTGPRRGRRWDEGASVGSRSLESSSARWCSWQGSICGCPKGSSRALEAAPFVRSSGLLSARPGMLRYGRWEPWCGGSSESPSPCGSWCRLYM